MIGDGRPRTVLLDSCAVIWLVNAEVLAQPVVDAISHAGHTDGVFVSTAPAWEIGVLSRPRPAKRVIPLFRPDPKAWFARLLAMPGIHETPITYAIAIDASSLPGDFHPDPIDRLIVATARHLSVPIVTGDRKILAYAEAGHVAVITC